jgi:hypothetical protein
VVTKAIVRSIDASGTKCVVEMPLFATASSSAPTAEALINITPGMFNNIFVNDIVFIAFEENALEKPIIIGKLFIGTSVENNTHGGAGILDSLKVRTSATIPCSTLFEYPNAIRSEYNNLKTPKKLADYILWIEKYFKKLVNQLDEHFRCFKNWTQWQLRPENVEIDDGDLDDPKYTQTMALLYQCEGGKCEVCSSGCTKNNKRQYTHVDTNKNYPNT